MSSSSRTADALFNEYIIERKSGLIAMRAFIPALMGLAYRVLQDPEKIGVLVLENPGITKERLEQESLRVLQTLNGGVAKRLRIVVRRNGESENVVGEIPPTLVRELQKPWVDDHTYVRSRLTGSSSYFVLLEIIIDQWLRDKGPMTLTWLMNTAGCSYPTAAATIDRLKDSIIRHSDRRIELRRFPNEEWSRLVIESDRARSTQRFADRSGRPRSPLDLLNRYRRLRRIDIAVGGSLCAKHYYPEMDLAGDPRIDFSIHAPFENVNLAFMDELDPALQKTDDRQEPANVAVHFVRRKVSLFEEGPDGILWADPTECLLDLQEMHLESQALQFVNHFTSKRRKYL